MYSIIVSSSLPSVPVYNDFHLHIISDQFNIPS